MCIRDRTNPAKGKIDLTPTKASGEEDPLARWRRLQDNKVARAVKLETQSKKEEPEVDTRAPAIEALSEAVSQQMDAILGSQEISGIQVKDVTEISYLEDLQQEAEARAEEVSEQNRGQESVAVNNSAEEILLPAGTIEYAQLLTEANTDVPGPILAEIVTGPLRGARLIGTFEGTYDYVTLNFDTVVIDGIDYSAEAVAIDPDTTLPGVVTEIDRRYFTRVVLPVAAEFISGYSRAISESGQTSITIEGDSVTQTTSNENDSDQEVASGIATAGSTLSEIINEYKDNRPQLLRVAAGTPLGIFFVDAVENEGDNNSSSFGGAANLGAITGQENR